MTAPADIAGAFASDAAAQSPKSGRRARRMGGSGGRSCHSCGSRSAVQLPKGIRQQPVETTVYAVLDQRRRPTGRSSTSFTAASNLAQRIGGSVIQAGES